MVQAFGVQYTADILWLTRPRFIAHHIYVEGIEGATLEDKERAAAGKWNRDFANADIVRRGTGIDTRGKRATATESHTAMSRAQTPFTVQVKWPLS